MKEIKLTRGRVALVDDEDYDYLNQWKWHLLKDKNNYYAVRITCINKVKSGIRMHRVIMRTPPELVVDHIDHNGLNNQKGNLRNCTISQNNKNVISTGRSKFLGVYFSEGKYIKAQIKINGKTTSLGLFKTEEEAAQAYDNMAKIHHGEFANLNFK